MLRCLYCCSDSLIFARFTGAGGVPRLVDLRVAEGSFEECAAFSAGMRSLDLPKRFRHGVQVIAGDLPLLPKTLVSAVVAPRVQQATILSDVARAFPFPLVEMAWDHAVLRDDGVEREIAVVACRRATVDALCQRLEEAGVPPASLQVSPVLAVAALQFAEPSPTVRFVIHVESVFIHFIWGEQSRYAIRTTRLDPEGCDQTALPSKIALEAARSEAAFRRQFSGDKTPEILLGGREIEGLEEALRTKLRVGVRRFPLPLVSDSIPRQIMAKVGLRLVPLLGAAALAGSPRASTIDLLPGARRTPARRKREAFRWVLGSICLLLGGMVFLGGEWHGLKTAEQQLRAFSGVLEPAEALRQQMEVEHDTIGRLDRMLDWMSKLATSRTSWSGFLVDLQERLVAVEDVWIDSLEIILPEDPSRSASRGPYHLRVSGRMVDRQHPLERVSANMRERVGQLLVSLGESPFIQEITDPQFDVSEPGILRFTFLLHSDPDRPL